MTYTLLQICSPQRERGVQRSCQHESSEGPACSGCRQIVSDQLSLQFSLLFCEGAYGGVFVTATICSSMQEITVQQV